jgi:hypothetical protein
MQKVLSSGLWKSIGALARRPQQRKAAIAYVTRDLVGFRKGDVLVVDASPRTIACGETNARLLRALRRKRVLLYHCADLHAKALLLGDVAVISSGNMSGSSADGLVEAAVLSDHASTVSGVASFIEQLVQQSEELNRSRIDELCRIKVIRRGGHPFPISQARRRTRITRLGNRTWLIGVRELVRDPAPDEQKMIAKALKSLHARTSDSKSEPDWIRWSGKNRFVRECREGDSLIQIWRSSRAKRPSVVVRAVSVLLKQQTTRWTRFYVPPATGPHAEMPWGRFKRLLKSLGYPRLLGPCIEHLLENDMADAIQRQWIKSRRPRGRMT